MDAHNEGWFSELSEMWPGQCLSLKVDKVLHKEKSQFQDILFLETKSYGRTLVLDGAIQCTERDEFSYQEMISFLALCSHPCPKNILIIGGGDGGVAREVAKHPDVQSIVQCEIDGRVVELSKRYLPFMACGFDSPKAQLHLGDGYEFMGKHKNTFDVIITDSSDPIGPAETLYQHDYYQKAKEALTPQGILCCQAENMWYHASLIKRIMESCKTVFNSVAYAYTCVPSYPGGQIGFLLCSPDKNVKFETPVRTFSETELEDMKLRYYCPAVHSAAFVLPRFLKKIFDGKNDAKHRFEAT